MVRFLFEEAGQYNLRWQLIADVPGLDITALLYRGEVVGAAVVVRKPAKSHVNGTKSSTGDLLAIYEPRNVPQNGSQCTQGPGSPAARRARNLAAGPRMLHVLYGVTRARARVGRWDGEDVGIGVGRGSGRWVWEG